ncbi:unnamed protein product [Closterium sp. NIES-53]
MLEFTYNNASHAATQNLFHFLCYGWTTNSQKQYADLQRRDHSVAVRDQVLLDTRNLDLSHLPSKLRPRFRGHFCVEAMVTPVTFLLRLPTTWKLHNAFHVQLLKPYKDPNQQFTGRRQPPPPPVLVQDEQEYQVEQVLTHRHRRENTLEFLISWKGYDPSEESWVAEADMGNARHALKDYEGGTCESMMGQHGKPGARGSTRISGHRAAREYESTGHWAAREHRGTGQHGKQGSRGKHG